MVVDRASDQRVADSITMSAYIEDGVLFNNVVVENSPDRQTTC